MRGADWIECLDHVTVFSEASLPRTLKCSQYYGHSRTHLSLAKDALDELAGQPSELGAVMELAEVGRLHYRHERGAA